MNPLAITRRSALAGAALLTGAAHTAPPTPRHFTDRIRAHCDALARAGDLSGVILLAHQGRPILLRAYGEANRAFGASNTPDTTFNIASIGKMFTAVAVLRLVEQRRLALADTLITHWPDYPDRAFAERATIEQLLTHTSGLGNYWAALAQANNANILTLADTFALFANESAPTEPGTFSYSNNGYIVLGMLIERLTGRDYFEHVRDAIFAPLGMTRTEFWRLDDIVPDLALGYARVTETPGLWRSNIANNVMRGSSAGGAYASAPDLLAFANALQNNRLLSADMTRAFTQGRYDYPRGRYGYGCSEEIINGHRLIGHSGGHIGIAGAVTIFEDLGYTAIVLTNGEVDAFWDVDNAIKRELVGEDAAMRNYSFTRGLINLIARDGLEAGLAAYASRDPSNQARESVIDVYGLKALHRSETPAALALLSFNTRAFPDSSSALWSLAEAQRISGDRAAALATYRAYLVKEPADADAERWIAALSG